MLKFQPKRGSIVYCDYKGFVKPEMVKSRPVVVVSRHKHNSKLLAVVPISTTLPSELKYYHIEMDPEFCKTHLSGERSWIKCDMFNVVSCDRLNLVRNRISGERSAPTIKPELLSVIKAVIKKFYGL